MNLSIKSTGFCNPKNSNLSDKNISYQPVRKLTFGNTQGDSISITGRNPVANNQTNPLTFGQNFIQAAKRVSQRLSGDKNAGVIGKELGKELYGIDIK